MTYKQNSKMFKSTSTYDDTTTSYVQIYSADAFNK